MKRKLVKRNKQRYTKMMKVADYADMYLVDYLSLRKTISDFNMKQRIARKSVEVLDFDNYQIFIGGRVLVPILYKNIRTGKVVDGDCCKMYSSLEEMKQDRKIKT